MTPEDLQQLSDVARRIPNATRVAVLGDVKALGACFPGAQRITRWDPGRQRTRGKYDLLVAANQLMVADNPAVTVANLRSACRTLLICEPSQRQRSAASELGGDGDRWRLRVDGERQPNAWTVDLRTHPEWLAAYSYSGGINAFGPSRHVLAAFSGALGAPLLRVDDYPTGVRPIAPDLEPLHDVLREMDDSGVPFHLGIVPAILDDPMMAFLKSLRNLVATVHGFDHRYPEKSAHLIASGDPDNQNGTVGRFNEFEGHKLPEIEDKLRRSRSILETGLSRPVTGYIPPCNVADRKTGKALMAAGYTHVYSERPIRGCALPQIKSAFYGRSNEYKPEFSAGQSPVLCLHATWEVDVKRAGATDALSSMMSDLAHQHKTARARSQTLANTVLPPG